MSEELVGMDQGFVFEHAPEALDLVLGPVGEIGQGAFVDPLALTAAFRAGGWLGESCGWGRFRRTWDNNTIYIFHYQ